MGVGTVPVPAVGRSVAVARARRSGEAGRWPDGRAVERRRSGAGGWTSPGHCSAVTLATAVRIS